MNAKTMEGLIGAGTNMNLVNTPMKVYREARRKDNFAVMERAMGYAGEFAGKADDYKTKAEEGMKEEAEENREREKAEREKKMEECREERREEREKLEEKVRESREGEADTVEVSEEARMLFEESMTAGDTEFSIEKQKTSPKPVTYTSSGKINLSVKAKTSEFSKKA